MEIMKKFEERFEEFVSTKENQSEYYISTDGLVCCDGNVVIYDEDLVDGHLPFNFGKVEGCFDCCSCPSLTSLEGSPKEVGRNFDCSYCTSLTTLEGAQQKVGGTFRCYKCTSLT